MKNEMIESGLHKLSRLRGERSTSARNNDRRGKQLIASAMQVRAYREYREHLLTPPDPSLPTPKAHRLH